MATTSLASPAIRAERLSKRYVLGEKMPGTFREMLSALIFPALWKDRHRMRVTARAHFWALKGVSFQVIPGEVVGIIGHNGAGKSTLLKILSRITLPTEGRAEIRGRLSSLLDVGTGFHPELTGRENIYLSAAILGMKRHELARRFDEIVGFSGVEEFLDTPVKRYSSGMYVRLAFSVAAHLEPEVLLVDEVLAVGDAEFQNKCLGKMHDVSGLGRTVLFVSHNMNAVEALCTRCLLLDRGVLRSEGRPADVIGDYLSPAPGNQAGSPEPRETGPLRVASVRLLNAHGYPTEDLWMGEGGHFEVNVSAQGPMEGVYVGLKLYDATRRHLFSFNSMERGFRPSLREGPNKLVASVRSLPLLPGRYYVQASVFTASKELSDILPRAAEFSVHAADIYGSGHCFTAQHGIVFIDHEWTQSH